MQYLAYMLFSFTGRISRGGFWLGVLIMAGLSIVATYILQPENFDLSIEKMPAPNFAMNVFNLLTLFIGMAITVKRLNDRDWPIWVAAIIFVICLPFYIGPFFGILWDIENPSWAELALWIVFGISVIFLLVDNGFLRGTRGDNRYGPDPLAGRS